MNYFRAIQKAGGALIKRAVHVPDFRLGIEKAETLRNIPIKVAYQIAHHSPVVEDPAKQPYEKVAFNGVNDGVTESMFEASGDAESLWAAIEAGRANNGY